MDGQQHVNPFEGLTFSQIYEGLMDGRFGPRWPSEQLQKGYTGTLGVDLLRRAFMFVEMLEQDGAFSEEDWRGLDYGCGWGRFLSVLLSKGTPDQADGCDAWERTLQIISELNYDNRIFRVSELIEPGEVPNQAYDFVLSFSVFTHLAHKAFHHNIDALLPALKPAGNLYITVRHDEFVGHKYKDRAGEIRGDLASNGIAFVDSGGNLGSAKVFGDTIVAKDYLRRFWNARYLGQPHSLQHVYALSR